MNDLLAKNEEAFNNLESPEQKIEFISGLLDEESRQTYLSLPPKIQAQLIWDRDPHGNVQVSRIETEVLMMEMVNSRLNKMKKEGKYEGKFSAQHHFFGYEGRCAPPSNFDADYTYSLGYGAVVLIKAGKTGYMSSISNITLGYEKWEAGGIPITMLLNMEQRHGQQKPVIRKALVELDGVPFQTMENSRKEWSVEDSYVYPGPIQYAGPSEVCDVLNHTLVLEER